MTTITCKTKKGTEVKLEISASGVKMDLAGKSYDCLLGSVMAWAGNQIHFCHERIALQLSDADFASVRDALKTARAEEKNATETQRKASWPCTVPGYDKLCAASREWAEYRYKIETQDSEYECACPIKRPASDIDALKAQYPEAAYIREMEGEALRKNDELNKIGVDAIEAMRSGKPWQEVKAEQVKASKAFVDAHFWD